VKLALIGNCSYQALIDDTATVVWLCWPRFDSSFVFGSLLDHERGGHFSVRPADEKFNSRQDYLPNTNILRTVFESASGSFEVIDFAPRFMQYDRSFKPAMLMRRARRLSGSPRVVVRLEPMLDYGRKRPGYYLASNHIHWDMDGTALRLTTTVPLTYATESRAFLLEEEAYFALTWGSPLEAPLAETVDNFLDRTRRYWERWVKHTSMPGLLQREVIRSALVLKLHQFEDTGAFTAAATTSLPEEHGSGRNWDYRFCWLRDSYFTLRAMRRLGQFEEMERFVTFLKQLVEAHPNRLQPVFAISGDPDLHEIELPHLSGYHGNQPVRAGNAAYQQVQNDVYGEMVGAMTPLLLDVRFENGNDQGHNVRLVKNLLRRMEATLEEPDAGIWEYRGSARVHTFSVLLQWAGAKLARHIGEYLGDGELTDQATRIAGRARDLIEATFVESEGYYGDSTTSENPDASLFMMVNLGYLKPSDPRARQHVRALASKLLLPNGLMQRYRHLDDFGESKSSFTVCGFWYAEALARLGAKAEAAQVCERIASHANHVGLFSEDIDPATGEQLGNFPQTYSHVGLINAAFAISSHPDDVPE
jgi:GH15 family glucan-1,4-alpha-glucosidase